MGTLRNSRKPLGAFASMMLVWMFAVATAPVAQAQIVPVNSNTNGNSYSEWSAKWVQWVAAIPASANPALDSTGTNCSQGQSGPVWFLAGTFGGPPVSRNCTIPAGKSVFFPIVNGFFGAGAFDCYPTNPKVACNIATLRAAATASMDSVIISAELDGVPLDLSDQRVQSPDYPLTWPDGNIAGIVRAGNIQKGTYLPNVADGYWVMLTPLAAGTHTLHFRGAITGGVFSGNVIEVTYHLTQL